MLLEGVWRKTGFITLAFFDTELVSFNLWCSPDPQDTFGKGGQLSHASSTQKCIMVSFLIVFMCCPLDPLRWE